jgi:tRNA threonylcarbamoyladenosine biosynthesis protein TsaB
MTLILGLDTSTNFVGVALADNGTTVAAESHFAARQHAEVMAPTIVDVLSSAGVTPHDLAAIAVGIGPGLFTGLRVGVTTALVMAQALDIPLLAVSSLELMAAGLGEVTREIVTVFDAKRGEVFYASFRAGDPTPVRLSVDAVVDPTELVDQLMARASDLVLLGDAVSAYPEIFARLAHAEVAETDFWVPSVTALVGIAASRLARGEVDPLESVVPNYLRTSDAVIPTGRKGSR